MTHRGIERFTDIERYPRARDIADIALRASSLTDDFSGIERIPRLADSRRENDVEHSFMLAITAPAIAEKYYPELGIDTVRRFAIVHDMLEIEVGDVATFDLTEAELAEKDRREHAAKQTILARLKSISPDLADDLEEYERQDTPEAIFVRMVDKLLPVAVDSTGDGLRVIREDYGIKDKTELEGAHDELYSRMLAKFGRDFPDLVAAHGVLLSDFEAQYPDESTNDHLRVRETVRGPIETERKFIIDALPSNLDLKLYPRTELRQGYVVVNSDGAETRIRSFDNDRFELTVKSPGAVQRGEQTIKLPKEMFEVLWAQTAGMRVEKTRYNIPYEKYTIELDVYGGHLSGLMTAEVEFSGRAEEAAVKAEVFEAPEWFGKDVSKDRRYKNQNLAQGFPREHLHLGAKQL